jgi:hypothetical protein
MNDGIQSLIKNNIMIIVIIIVIAYLYYRARHCESFATLQNKASTYKTWMTNNPGAKYSDFSRANPDANIVEYNKMRKIYTQPIEIIANSLRIA